MRILHLITLLIFFSVCIQSPTVQAQMGTQQSASALKDQGMLYYKKKMFPLAKTQFDQAYALADGAKDFNVVYYRALVCYELLQLEVAFEMAEIAVKIATEEQDKNDAQSLLEKLNGLFSYVIIEPAKEETNKKGRIYLEAKTKILNQQKRESFESIRARFREMDVTLPTRIYLPYGSFKANNVPFNIVEDPDEIPKVQVFFHIIQDENQKRIPTWLIGSLGVAGAAAVGLTTYFLFFNTDPEERFRTNLNIVGGGAQPAGK